MARLKAQILAFATVLASLFGLSLAGPGKDVAEAKPSPPTSDPNASLGDPEATTASMAELGISERIIRIRDAFGKARPNAGVPDVHDTSDTTGWDDMVAYIAFDNFKQFSQFKEFSNFNQWKDFWNYIEWKDRSR